MKKVKFMLLSLALVAVVGGALAFKAKFQSTYCTTTPVSGICKDALGVDLTCTTTTLINYTTTDDTKLPFYCYTTKDAFNPCLGQACIQESFIKGN